MENTRKSHGNYIQICTVDGRGLREVGKGVSEEAPGGDEWEIEEGRGRGK